jgi:hypothetical protein
MLFCSSGAQWPCSASDVFAREKMSCHARVTLGHLCRVGKRWDAERCWSVDGHEATDSCCLPCHTRVRHYYSGLRAFNDKHMRSM